jgi:hypothetical protein
MALEEAGAELNGRRDCSIRESASGDRELNRPREHRDAARSRRNRQYARHAPDMAVLERDEIIGLDRRGRVADAGVEV